MESTMKVAVLEGVRKIGLIERPVPVPKSDEVLVQVENCGVCGSDLHYFTEGRIGDYVVKSPLVLGHETGGTVVKVGSGVQGLKVGDRVALEPGKTCGKCEFCRTGRYNLCPDVIFFATPPVDGTFQEYVAHKASLCFKIPNNMSTLEAALIEPLAVGFHAASQADAHVGQTAVVLGVGCIGLCCVMALRARGVTTIHVSDIVQVRLDKALEIGATEVINAHDTDPEKAIAQLTNNNGADIVIETAGSETTYRQAVKIAKPGATVVYVGYTPSGDANMPMSTVLNKELNIKSVFRYRHIYPSAIEAISKGVVDVKKLVSHSFCLDDMQTALDFSADHKEEVVKAVINI